MKDSTNHHDNLSIAQQRRDASACKACPLWKSGTQTVYGEGLETADIMIVGEQPGDKEDLAGRPFVGPAGKLLNDTLEKAGLARSELYITNAVKHFKWAPSPHEKYRKSLQPTAGEISACRQWLDRERNAIKPAIIVCLGAVAAHGVLGKTFNLTSQHGQWISPDQNVQIIITWHPSAILRSYNKKDRENRLRDFVEDLTKASKLLKKIKNEASFGKLQRTA